MEKYAYLIMAHNNFKILEKLIMLLDYPDNDIFVHIDAKIKNFNETEFLKLTKYSKIYFVPRVSVFWTDFSQTKAELNLLSYAKKTGSYKYYHLLSGCDLPLKTQGEIQNFFKNTNKEFVGICPKEVWYSVRRVKYYHPFTSLKSYRKNKFLKMLDRCLEYGQRLIGINRLKDKKIKIIDGWTWFSITEKFVEYILNNEKFIEETFSNSIASDELFVQTMLYNSEFYKNIYDNDSLEKGSMRLIDWQRGRPYTFRKEDLQILEKSSCLFARKFDENIDFEIVETIYKNIYEKQQKMIDKL